MRRVLPVLAVLSAATISTLAASPADADTSSPGSSARTNWIGYGWHGLAASDITHPDLLAPYAPRSLPTLGGDALGIRYASAGTFLGESYDEGGTRWIVRWDEAGNIHPLIGGSGLLIDGMGADGTAFGTKPCDRDADEGNGACSFIFRADGSVPHLPLPEGVTGWAVYAVNDNGDIRGAGWGTDTGGDSVNLTLLWRPDGGVDAFPADDVVNWDFSGTLVYSAGPDGNEDMIVRDPQRVTHSLRPVGARNVRYVDMTYPESGLLRLVLDVDGARRVVYIDMATGETFDRDRAAPPPPPALFGYYDDTPYIPAAGFGWLRLPTMGGRGWAGGALENGRYYGTACRLPEGQPWTGCSLVIWEPLAGTTTVSVPVTSDTYVNTMAPRTPYGTASSLAAGGAAQYRALLHADVPAAPAGKTLVGARLRVHTSTQPFAGSTAALSVSAVSGWTDATTAATAPPAGPLRDVLGSFAAVGRDAWATTWLDTTRVTHGKPLDLAVGALGAGQPVDSLWFWSREYPRASYRPTLELIYR